MSETAPDALPRTSFFLRWPSFTAALEEEDNDESDEFEVLLTAGDVMFRPLPASPAFLLDIVTWKLGRCFSRALSA